MQYGIVVFPRKDVQDRANSYRKRYDPHYSLIPPHITLLKKIELTDEEVESTAQKLDEISANVAPFTAHLHKVSHFFPVTPTVYLAVEDPKPFEQLHQLLLSVFPHHKPEFDFIPHLTIGQKMEEQELHDIYGRLRMMDFGLTSKIDRFHLMYQLENESWSIYQTFVLRGS